MIYRRPIGANDATGNSAGEDALTRLIRLIARQAAQEAFAVFKDALEASIAQARTASEPESPTDGPAEQTVSKTPQSPEPGERLLSVAEVAKRLDVSEKTVRRKVKSGELPAHRVGKLIRIGESGLSACLAKPSAGSNKGLQ
jgi:excisionase family DNA binding protein